VARQREAAAAVAASKAQLEASQSTIYAANAQILGAQSSVAATQAAEGQIQAQIDDTVLKAARNGRVQYRIAQLGEVPSIPYCRRHPSLLFPRNAPAHAWLAQVDGEAGGGLRHCPTVLRRIPVRSNPGWSANKPISKGFAKNRPMSRSFRLPTNSTTQGRYLRITGRSDRGFGNDSIVAETTRSGISTNSSKCSNCLE